MLKIIIKERTTPTSIFIKTKMQSTTNPKNKQTNARRTFPKGEDH